MNQQSFFSQSNQEGIESAQPGESGRKIDSKQSSEIEKYRTTLNFDELSQGSLGIMMSSSQQKAGSRKFQHQVALENQNKAVKDIMQTLLAPSPTLYSLNQAPITSNDEPSQLPTKNSAKNLDLPRQSNLRLEELTNNTMSVSQMTNFNPHIQGQFQNPNLGASQNTQVQNSQNLNSQKSTPFNWNNVNTNAAGDTSVNNDSVGVINAPSEESTCQQWHPAIQVQNTSESQDLKVSQFYGKPVNQSNEMIFSGIKSDSNSIIQNDQKDQETSQISNSRSFNFDKMQSLLTEKERVKADLHRINQNKSLTRKDRNLAVKSINNLGKTIDDLIGKEKTRLNDNFESQLMSKLNNSQNQQNIDHSVSSHDNSLKESQLIQSRVPRHYVFNQQQNNNISEDHHSQQQSFVSNRSDSAGSGSENANSLKRSQILPPSVKQQQSTGFRQQHRPFAQTQPFQSANSAWVGGAQSAIFLGNGTNNALQQLSATAGSCATQHELSNHKPLVSNDTTMGTPSFDANQKSALYQENPSNLLCSSIQPLQFTESLAEQQSKLSSDNTVQQQQFMIQESAQDFDQTAVCFSGQLQEQLLKYNELLSEQEKILLENERLRSKVEQFEQKQENEDRVAESEVEYLRAKISQLESKEQSLQLDGDLKLHQHMQAMTEQYEVQLQALQAIIKDKSDQIQAHKSLIESYEQKLAQISDIQAQLRVENDQLHQEMLATNSDHKNQLQKKEQQKTEALQQLDSLQDTNEELSNQIKLQNHESSQFKLQIVYLEQQISELKESAQQSNDRLDQTLQVTQKDRLQGTLSRQEKIDLLQQIQVLKKSETDLKKRLGKVITDLPQPLTQRQKDIIELQEKYTNELEANRSLQTRVDELINLQEEQQSQVTSFKNENFILRKDKEEWRIKEVEFEESIRVLRESVQMKITCLDDMQRLLQESRCQNLEYKELYEQALKDKQFYWKQQQKNQITNQKNQAPKTQGGIRTQTNTFGKQGSVNNQNKSQCQLSDFGGLTRDQSQTSTVEDKQNKMNSDEENKGFKNNTMRKVVYTNNDNKEQLSSNNKFMPYIDSVETNDNFVEDQTSSIQIFEESQFKKKAEESQMQDDLSSQEESESSQEESQEEIEPTKDDKVTENEEYFNSWVNQISN